MATATEQLLVRIDATTEQLRREMRRADQDVARAGGSINRNLGTAERGTQRFDRAMAGAGQQAQRFAGRLGPIGSALAAIGPAGLAAAAALGAMTMGLRSAVREASEFERIGMRTEAVVRATGEAAGFTAGEIREMAGDIAQATLATRQGVENAAQRLMMFGNIAGDAFGRTLRLAQDMAALGLGSIESASLQLGRALEDPVRGLDALRRAGVIFTQSQRDMIQEMVGAGRAAEAQDFILGELERRIGGAGEAEAGGLAGAVDSLGQAWSELKVGLGDTWAIFAATEAINFMAIGVRELGVLIGSIERPLEQQARALNAEFDAAIAKLREMEAARDRATREPGEFRGFLGALLLDIERQSESVVEIQERLLGVQGELAERERETARRREEAARKLAERLDAERKAAEERAAAEKRAKEQTAAATAAERERTRELDQQRRKYDERMRAQLAAELAVEDQIASIERETELLGMTVEQREMALELARQQALAEDDLVKVTDDHVKRLEDAVRARQQQRRVSEQQRQLERDIARAAEEAAREWERVWDEGARGIQRSLAEAFDNALAGGINSFRDFGRSVLGIMRNIAAQIAAMLVFRPVMGQVAGAVGLGGAAVAGGSGGLLGGGGSGFGLGNMTGLSNIFSLQGIGMGTAGGFSGLNTFAASNLGFGLPGMPGSLTSMTLGSVLGAGGLGAFGGGLIASLMGGDPMIGSAGGGIGAGLGLMVGGPIGAAIGGIAGGLLGGLFGGRSSVGPIGHTNIGMSGGQLVVGATGADNSANPAVTIQQAQLAVQTINDLAAALGLQVGTAGLRGIRQGGTVADHGGTPGVSSALDFVLDFLRRPDAFLGAPAALTEALSGVRDLDGAVQAVDGFLGQQAQLKAAFEAMSAGAAGLEASIEQAANAIRGQLRAQIDALREEAKRFGLEMVDVDAALRTAFDEETRRALLGMTDPVALAMEQLDRDQRMRLEVAKELGADLVQLERLFGEERRRVMEQSTSDLRAFIDGLFFDQRLTPHSAMDRLAESRGLFARAIGAGDVGGAQEEAQRLLGLSRDVFASSPAFQQDFRAVVAALEGLGKGLDLPGFAAGTLSAPRGLAVVHGNELINFRGGEQVTSASDTRSLFGMVAGSVDRVGMMLAEGQAEQTRELRAMKGRLEGLETRMRRMERAAAA